MAENKTYDTVRTMHGTFHTTLNKKFMARKPWRKVNPNHVLSFMPGMVLAFDVKVGDKVKKGDQLMLFRAMKMDNRILSPVDGAVKAIHVAEGVNVAKNTLMIELE